MILLLIFSTCVGYMYYTEAKEHCLSAWKLVSTAIILYIFTSLTAATIAKAILKALDLHPAGIVSLFISLTVGVLSLIPLTFVNKAIKRKGSIKEKSS